tara:strand:+ start:68 stop:565 length:498 start_codon:yes stop_codon:yes gene_type:complete
MELLKHVYNKLYSPHWESWLYKTEKGYLKETHSENRFDGITLNRFIEEFDCIAEPINLDCNDNVLKYEIPDYKINHLTDLSYSEQLKIFSQLIGIMNSFMMYSIALGHNKIFCHNDFGIYNMFIVDDKIKLIDLDSFEWMTKEQFHNHLSYTATHLPTQFNLNKL